MNVHLQQEMCNFAAEHKDWLIIFPLPSYAPEINPQEGIWSLLKRALVPRVRRSAASRAARSASSSRGTSRMA